MWRSDFGARVVVMGHVVKGEGHIAAVIARNLDALLADITCLYLASGRYFPIHPIWRKPFQDAFSL